jgi:hypothetical protein
LENPAPQPTFAGPQPIARGERDAARANRGRDNAATESMIVHEAPVLTASAMSQTSSCSNARRQGVDVASGFFTVCCQQKTGVQSANGMLQLMSFLRALTTRNPSAIKAFAEAVHTASPWRNVCGQIAGLHSKGVRIMKGTGKRFFCFSTAILSALILAAPSAVRAAPEVLSNAVANGPIHFDVSPALVELVTAGPAQQGVVSMHKPLQPKLQQFTLAPQSQIAGAKSTARPSVVPAIGANIGLSFEGVGNTSFLNCPSVAGQEVAPPDTNAAVGDTQVVEWVNTCYAVFDKSTGALIAGPFAGTNFWKGFGAPCETNNDGDIIIQWDKGNHRWLAAQNVFNGPPYYTCVAVSQTADATGSYFRYTFPQQAGFPDYPKWGLTRGVYYQTQNIFNDALNAFLGVHVCAYDAKSMLSGKSNAQQVCILDDSNGTLFDDSMLPADDDADAGGPTKSEVLLGAIDNFLPGDTHVYEFVFTVNFGNPAKSTLAGVDGSMPISVPAFNLALCAPGGFLTTDCVPQPGTTALLDTLGDRLMYRLAHFNERGTQHFLVTHSVNNNSNFTAGGVAATWYEFRAKGYGTTNLSLYQSGQTPNDGENRWMGSVAMDQAGDIALGYSRSSATPGDFPSIYYAGQTAGDPLGTTETETLIKQGTGFQPDTDNRWGDYSSMALDGADSCTFWYANEYYDTNTRFNWATWLASLRFPGCGR